MVATITKNGNGTETDVEATAPVAGSRFAKAAGAPSNEARIALRRIERRVMVVPIVGTTPLIQQKWSEKAKRQMRDKQMGKEVKAKKDPKNPEQDAHDATYWIEDGAVAGVPAVAFKAALVGACRAFDGITMTAAKTMFFVHGIPTGDDILVPIEDAAWAMREDTPRNATGVADLRYRNQFWPWRATLRIEFAPSRIDPEAVLALVEEAGHGGVGEWRPSAPKSATGVYGQFRIDEDREVSFEGV